MSNDNTQDKAEPSPASDGSRVVAWAVEHSGSIVYVAIRASDAQEWAGLGPVDVVPLYRHPQPTLTDEEREAIKVCESVYSDNDMDAECWRIAATLRDLLERLA
jgi:hypothetical protein